MPLRRAQLLQFLANWIKENELVIIVNSLEEVLQLKQAANCRLVIFSVGSARLSDAKLSAAVRILSVLYPEAPLIVMGESNDAENADCARSLGASAYLPACLEADVALAAFSFVLAGGTYFSPDVMEALKNTPPSIPPQEKQARLSPPPKPTELEEHKGPEESNTSNGGSKMQSATEDPEQDCSEGSGPNLTCRQSEVLSCLKVGLSNKHIARELNMSEATVKVHVRQVMRKLGACNRTQAVILAMASSEERPKPYRPSAAVLTLLRSEAAPAMSR